MTTSNAVRASEVNLDTPGFREILSDYQGLAPLFLFQTASVTLSTAASTAIVPALMPFNARIEALIANVTTSIVTAATAITVGVSGDTDAYATGGMSLPVVTAPETYIFKRSDITTLATIPAGTAVLITNTDPPTAGAATFTLIVSPVHG